MGRHAGLTKPRSARGLFRLAMAAEPWRAFRANALSSGAAQRKRLAAAVSASETLRRTAVAQRRRSAQPGAAQAVLRAGEVAFVCAQLRQGRPQAQRRAALERVRDALARDDSLVAALVSNGAATALGCFLSEADSRCRFDAAWCLTNLACGATEHARAVLQSGPALIALLSGADALLQEQAAWALGNVAGDAHELRLVLCRNGAVRPLLDLLRSRRLTVARTAAWALSNLCVCDAAAVDARSLVSALAEHGDAAVAAELLWVAAAVCARSEAEALPLAEAGAAGEAARRLADAACPREVAIPALRVLCALAAHSPPLAERVLASDAALAGLRAALAGGAPLRKEALWALSNLASGAASHAKRLVASGAVAAACSAATQCAPEELAEFAFFALNVAVWGRDAALALAAAGAPPALLHTLRAPLDDAAAAAAALKALVLVMQAGPEALGAAAGEARAAVEAACGADDGELRSVARAAAARLFAG
jgi:hypothetical protein